MAGGFALTQISDEGPVVIGGLIMVFGIALGPSAGHMYSGETSRPVWMFLGRLATLSLTAYGFALMAFSAGMGDGESSSDTARYVFWSGAFSTAGLVLWDIIDSPFSATRANQTHNKRRLYISPQIIPPPPTADVNTPAFGIVLTGRF